jgi:hypothetical protein
MYFIFDVHNMYVCKSHSYVDDVDGDYNDYDN